MPKLVRLHPYTPNEGHLLQRYGHRGYRFFEERGWYKVSDALAKELAQVRQPRAPGSKSKGPTPLAFIVADTKAQAKVIERAAEPKPVKASVDDPNVVEGADLTTADLAGGTTEEEAPPARRSSRGGRSTRRRSGSR